MNRPWPPMTEFDTDAICRIAEERLNAKCLSIKSYGQGSNHRMYMIELERVGKAVARIEASNHIIPTFPAPWKMSSEVATLRYIKENTTIPVPTVYFHDHDEKGEIGAQWMLSEWIDGITLWDSWAAMSIPQREECCMNIAEIWAQLLSLRFDTVGSLYEHVDGNRFVVGPIAPLPNTRIGVVAPPDKEQCGPFNDVNSFFNAIASRKWHYQPPPAWPTAASAQNQPSVLAHLQALSKIDFGGDSPSNMVALYHQAIEPANIIVDKHNPTIIKGIVDWEYTVAFPLWCIELRPFSSAKLPGFDVHNPAYSSEECDCLNALVIKRLYELCPEWRIARIGDECRELRRLTRVCWWLDLDMVDDDSHTVVALPH